MGKKFAQVYATLVTGCLEVTLYENINAKGNQYTAKFINNWKTFLDNCLIHWTQSKSELLELENIPNTLHPDINFTMECHNLQQLFLDVMVIKQGTRIKTDMYHKPTISKQYLLFSSCHPKHTNASLPFS